MVMLSAASLNKTMMVSGWWWWWLEAPLLLIMATLRMVTAQNCSHFEADCGFEKRCKMIGLHFGWPAIDCDQKVYIKLIVFWCVSWLHQLHNRWDRLMVSSRSPSWNPLLAATRPFYSVCIDTRPSFLSIIDMWSNWCHIWQQPDLLSTCKTFFTKKIRGMPLNFCYQLIMR